MGAVRGPAFWITGPGNRTQSNEFGNPNVEMGDRAIRVEGGDPDARVESGPGIAVRVRCVQQGDRPLEVGASCHEVPSAAGEDPEQIERSGKADRVAVKFGQVVCLAGEPLGALPITRSSEDRAPVDQHPRSHRRIVVRGEGGREMAVRASPVAAPGMELSLAVLDGRFVLRARPAPDADSRWNRAAS